MPDKQTYYVTFGQRSPFRDGWVEILASSKDKAKIEAEECFGKEHYSSIYEADQWDDRTRSLYPHGKLGHTKEGY